jgi:(S)-2-hydroxyglutarate dehydrogenase
MPPTPHTPTYDYLIIGGGIVGLTVAREIAERAMGSVAVLEKEPALGAHGSGRNSGVIHAGIYYKAHTLRARICRDGARRMRDFAEERDLPWKKNGKVIVATAPETVPQIDVLLERATANGLEVEKITPEELRRIEPEARTHEAALYSPDTAVIDPRTVLAAVRVELERLGVSLLLGRGATGVDEAHRTVRTDGGSIGFGTLINTAGLHADHVAGWMGVGRGYQILPFKGLYRALSAEASARFRGNIYPAPDLRLPFLGVHITPDAYGGVMVGPTAIPAFGRENYGWLEGLEAREGARMLQALGIMLTYDRQGMRSLVRAEVGRYTAAGFLREARSLAPGLRAEDIEGVCKVGLRSQLVDRKTKELVNDYVMERTRHSLHVLNAISPAFTSAFSLAEVIVEAV